MNMSIGFFILGLVFIVAGVYLHFRARLKSTDENRRITGILTLAEKASIVERYPLEA